MRGGRFILPTLAATCLISSATLAGVLLADADGWGRPSLQVAKRTAYDAAGYQCYNVFFPLDPYKWRCKDFHHGSKYHIAAGHGDAKGSWYFPRAWARNRSNCIWRFRLRVTFECVKVDEVPPCYNIRAYKSGAHIEELGTGCG